MTLSQRLEKNCNKLIFDCTNEELFCGILKTIDELKSEIKTKDEKKKLARYQKIAESGAKQSGRGIIPKVEKILDFKSMLDEASKASLPILCYEGDGTKSLKEILKENKIENDIAIIIGAEGGFSQKEVELAKEKSIHLAGLGKRILRCETAPTFALSCIAYETEL